MPGNSDLVDIDCTMTGETKLAYWIKVEAPGGEKKVSVPKSVVELSAPYRWGTNNVCTMPQWMAEEKGLV